MRKKSFGLAGLLLVAALVLSACGGAGSTTWPGMATDGTWAYLASGTQVRAVNASSGAEQWAFPNPVDNTYGVFVSDPSVSPDLVVVGSEGPANSYSGVLFGLDRATGQRQWCLAFDAKGGTRQNCPVAPGRQGKGIFGITTAVDHRIIGGLALVDGVVYFGLASGTVYAVDTASHTVLWYFDEPRRDIWATPLVSDQAVYVASLDHHVYALERATGKLIWKQDMGAAVAGTPTLDGDTLYVGTFANTLVALDAANNGKELWKAPATNWVWSGPAVHAGMLYFTDVGGTVFAVDAASHEQLWSAKPGGPMRARPLVTDEYVFIGDRTGNLFALNRATGTTAWTKAMQGKVKGQILVTPLLITDQVIVAPFGGTNLLEAYSTTGDFKWAFAPGK